MKKVISFVMSVVMICSLMTALAASVAFADEKKPADVFYVVGEEKLTGVVWGNEFKSEDKIGLKMEFDDEAKRYMAISGKLEAGTYEYKIVQDPMNCGWTYAYGDVNSNNGEANLKVDVKADAPYVVFLFDTEGSECATAFLTEEEHSKMADSVGSELGEDNKKEDSSNKDTSIIDKIKSPATGDNAILIIAVIAAVVSIGAGVTVVTIKKSRS